ncbi:alpha/beta fold hydrolase [Kaistia dalseonensis]|uniref:Pimeloyl-ACP methyl ester carboxylesterase n=1 Tax=Kaistia dalseonensis TaxID=410840 RepID=A0ABU0H8W8_9HYPH|nr:alpha/beta fold hydrolase [Kaistia dalseonensis]MCX5496159.1 alpha/beta fold hydrolase [Kaistia dalseonensis]MDQ0438769.1 pimeloyl-ACP methyl ester carboxylesterase [Kaistia dalseonensis]
MSIVTANGIEQAMVTAGPADGAPVLLVHGLGWDHTLWSGQIETLAARGWRVIAPDLRGMGLSAKPDMAYSIDLYARDLLALTDALDLGPFAIAGFSLGGIIATAMIEQAPSRIGAAVIACCGVHTTAEGEAGTEAMLARSAGLGPLAFAREQAAAIWHPDFAAANPDRVEQFIAWRAAMDQAALTRAFRAGYGIDYRPGLARITAPVRLIAADRDPFASVATMAAMREAIPGADLVVIENAGHMAPIEQRDAFDAALVACFESAWPARAG